MKVVQQHQPQAAKPQRHLLPLTGTLAPAAGDGKRTDAGGQDVEPPAKASPVTRIVAVLTYGAVSGSLTFFNKAVVSVYNFQYPLTILALQMAVSISVLQLAKRAGWIDFPEFNAKTARTIWPITALYSLNVLFALSSLSRVNVPMYNVLKRLTPFVILVVNYLVWRKSPSLRFCGTIALMVVGAVIAGLGDAAFSADGYWLAFGSCLSQAGYLVYVQWSGNAKAGLSAHGLLYFQSVMSLPVFAVLSAGVEVQAIQTDPTVTLDSSLALVLLLSSILGSTLNFCLFFCTLVNSALTTTIVGVAKGTLTTLIGMFVMTAAAPTAINSVGIAVNTVGAVVYALIKAGVVAA